MKNSSKAVAVPDGPPDVKERLEFLLDTSPRHDLEQFGNEGRFVSEWLGPNSRIRSAVYSRGFVLDDLSMYADFAQQLTQVDVDITSDDARAAIDVFLRSRNSHYNGGARAFLEFEMGSKFKLTSIFTRNGKPKSAYDSRREGRSCGLITAEAHNLARFLGIPNITVVGSALYGLGTNNINGGGHAFSLTRSDDDVKLWDPTNPGREQGADGGVNIVSFQEQLADDMLIDLLTTGVRIKNKAIKGEQDERLFEYRPALLFPDAIERAKVGTVQFAAIAESLRQSDEPRLRSEALATAYRAIATLPEKPIDPYFLTFFEARAAG